MIRKFETRAPINAYTKNSFRILQITYSRIVPFQFNAILPVKTNTVIIIYSCAASLIYFSFSGNCEIVAILALRQAWRMPHWCPWIDPSLLSSFLGKHYPWFVCVFGATNPNSNYDWIRWNILDMPIQKRFKKKKRFVYGKPTDYQSCQETCFISFFPMQFNEANRNIWSNI